MYKEMYVFESSCLVGFCISLNQEPTQVTHLKLFTSGAKQG